MEIATRRIVDAIENIYCDLVDQIDDAKIDDDFHELVDRVDAIESTLDDLDLDAIETRLDDFDESIGDAINERDAIDLIDNAIESFQLSYLESFVCVRIELTIRRLSNAILRWTRLRNVR